VGTHWKTGKNGKIFPPPPHPPAIKLAWKVQCPLSKWTLDNPLKYSLKQKPPLQPPTLAIGNALGEHIENLGNNLGTWWEHISNCK